jgi:ditrans,polycis-polyprenyl diphosphate synthase
MTWFIEDKRSYAQKLFGNIIKQGPIPKHVALIMDGNRRYARQNHIEQIEGHKSGFNKLGEALNWCFTMDIKECTVYAFSIENFKRPIEEVDELMKLAIEKFKNLLEERDKIKENQVCIRVFGDLSLLPKELQLLMAKIIDISKNNSRLYLNVCFVYTSREEILLACKEISEGTLNKRLELNDIDETLIDNCLCTSNSEQVDLLMRTSGEVRLSDFLLWQSSNSTLSFVNQLWPELNIWQFYFCILNYQLNIKLNNKKNKIISNNNNNDKEMRISIFLYV